MLRFEAGLYLDPLLCRLTRASGTVDRALARGLSRLRSSRGYVRLGYARFADYTRERIDMSVRTAQEMNRLATRTAASRARPRASSAVMAAE